MTENQIFRMPYKYKELFESMDKTECWKLIIALMQKNKEWLENITLTYYNIIMVDIENIENQVKSGQKWGKKWWRPPKEKRGGYEKEKGGVMKTETQDKISKDKISKDKEIIVSKDTTAISEKKQITEDIDFLINEIKQVCISYWLAYDKTQERNFAKHILTAKEYWDFAEKVWIDRVRLAKNIVALSQKWWKSISWPKDIYQNYAKCYNDCKTKSESSKIVKIETLDW